LNLSLDIARRYLLGKKSTNAINIITWVSITGLSIGTAALITILSVFNGFEEVLIGLFDSFNPQIKVTPISGKYFTISDTTYTELLSLPEVGYVSRSLEEVALFDYDGVQEVGIIKGVDDQYKMATDIDSSLRVGKFVLEKSRIRQAIFGSGLSNKLSINHNDALTPVDIYLPTIENKGPLAKDYKQMPFYPSGVFTAGSEADMQYAVTHIDYVAELLDLKDTYSHLEIKLNSSTSTREGKAKVLQILGPEFKALDRYEQDETFFKVMNTEKWVSFVIASFILFIIAFNLVGSLWMLVLEKKLDLSILQALGFTRERVRNLILSEGILVTVLGLVSGIILAVIIYFLQKTFGLISIPDGFMIDSYPIKMKLLDILLVSATVLSIGILASLLPALRAAKITPYVRQEV
jgi:lipoprotein-releasing system permease protein